MTPNPPSDDAVHVVDRALASLLLRLALGVIILLHGLTRLFIGGLHAFVNSSAAPFQHDVLPMWEVRAFLTVLPFLEFTVGLLLLAGFALRWTLVTGALLMLALEFGTGMRSDWPTISNQLIYSLLYSLLLFCRRYDVYSLDGWRNRQRAVALFQTE
jgi:thiosulfate dehydrogenase [quinone] large subunit